MPQSIFYIKNMVCPRCVTVMRDILESLDLIVEEVELGKAVVRGEVSLDERRKLQHRLEEQGFELLTDPDQQISERIKNELLRYLERLENNPSEQDLPNLSDYLGNRLHRSYSALSKLFSDQENITIEKYLIRLKIERVKELVSYGELTLSEIAYKLRYSSVQYLSNQFKQITGMSVSDFKKAHDSFRKPLDQL